MEIAVLIKASPPVELVHDLQQRVRSLTAQMKQAEISMAEIRLNARRYMYLRRLNVRQFSDLYLENLDGKGPFDALVDRNIARSR